MKQISLAEVHASYTIKPLIHFDKSSDCIYSAAQPDAGNYNAAGIDTSAASAAVSGAGAYAPSASLARAKGLQSLGLSSAQTASSPAAPEPVSLAAKTMVTVGSSGAAATSTYGTNNSTGNSTNNLTEPTPEPVQAGYSVNYHLSLNASTSNRNTGAELNTSFIAPGATAPEPEWSLDRSLNWPHDAAGNQLRDFNDNFQLGYDAAGRLARFSYGNGSSFQFYDLNGQRIFKTDSQSDVNFNTQNPAGSLNPSTAGVFYQCDPNGNLLWQQTVSAVSGGLSTGFLEHETATHYYWLPNEHGDILIGFDQGANSYAVYTDHLNTPRLVTKIENPQNPRAETDTSNDLTPAPYGQPQGISPLAIPVWQWSYSPFGADLANGYEARPTTLANNFKPDLWTWTGLPETGGADPNQVAQETWRVQANLVVPPVLNLRYPGQYYDFEVGLVQNWWRTYEPRIGRYSSADPIGLNGGWNRFGYAYQDGVNRYDKSGQSVLPVVLGVAGAAWLAYTLQDDYYAGKTEACRREINQQYRKKYEEVCSKHASTWKASDWYVLNQFPKEIRASAMGSAGEVIDRSMGAGLGGATGAISGDGISAIGKNFFTSFGAYQAGLNSGCSF